MGEHPLPCRWAVSCSGGARWSSLGLRSAVGHGLGSEGGDGSSTADAARDERPVGTVVPGTRVVLGFGLWTDACRSVNIGSGTDSRASLSGGRVTCEGS